MIETPVIRDPTSDSAAAETTSLPGDSVMSTPSAFRSAGHSSRTGPCATDGENGGKQGIAFVPSSREGLRQGEAARVQGRGRKR
jgi:hypothetical protein